VAVLERLLGSLVFFKPIRLVKTPNIILLGYDELVFRNASAGKRESNIIVS
jgi:hypothetical protein